MATAVRWLLKFIFGFMLFNSVLASSELEETAWRLVQMGDNETEDNQSLIVATARFVNGSVNGKSGCNIYFGQYRLDGDKLSFTRLGATQKNCGLRAMEGERDYLKRMRQVTKFKVENDRLQLLDKQQVLLTFVINEPATLEGSWWQATGIDNGRGVVLSNAHTGQITALFEDGTINGNAGCNQYSATYQVKGKHIQIGPSMTTRKHCGEDAVMETEKNFLAALQKAHVFELSEDRLNLHSEQGALLVSFKLGAVDKE